MNIRRALLGPSDTEQSWRRLTQRVGGTFVEGPLLGFGSEKVQLQVHDSTVTLDTFTFGENTYTRIRAPFWNDTGVRFRLARISQWKKPVLLAAAFVESLSNAVLSGRLNWLPARLVDVIRAFCHRLEGLAIRLGDQEFDSEFHVTGNDPVAIRKFLSDPQVLSLLRQQPRLRLEIRTVPHMPALPREVTVLHFEEQGVVQHVDRLERLFELFSHLVQGLAAAGSEESDPVEKMMNILATRNSQIRDGNAILWDGNAARSRAARELGRRRHREAAPLLCEAVNDTDHRLRLNSIRALGEIGDQQAIPALIPLLGEANKPPADSIGEAAAVSLKKLGESALVSDFFKLLQRDSGAAARLKQNRREEVVLALRRRLATGEGRRLAAVAWALAHLGAVEALPELRALRLRLVFADAKVKEDWKQAIHELEALAALPRPAEGGLPPTDSLPRGATLEVVDSLTLPRVETQPREIAT